MAVLCTTLDQYRTTLQVSKESVQGIKEILIFKKSLAKISNPDADADADPDSDARVTTISIPELSF